MLRVAMKAPHWLVLARGVSQSCKSPAAFGGTPGRLTTPSAALARSKARPVAAGALLALVPEALN